MAFAPTARLDALAARLSVYDDLDVEPGGDAVRVRSTTIPGCCSSRRGDKIRCQYRQDDGGRLWFYTSWGEPIAEAGRVIDASVAIHGYIAGTR